MLKAPLCSRASRWIVWPPNQSRPYGSQLIMCLILADLLPKTIRGSDLELGLRMVLYVERVVRMLHRQSVLVASLVSSATFFKEAFTSPVSGFARVEHNCRLTLGRSFFRAPRIKELRCRYPFLSVTCLRAGLDPTSTPVPSTFTS